MVGNGTKLRWRKNMRMRKKQAKNFGNVAEDSFNKYIFKRLIRLVQVRRFIISWLGLLIVLGVGVVLQTRALSPYFLETKPISGGTYREGVVGIFTNANPLYAQTDVDTSVSRLVFSGLFTYDIRGQLVSDIAERYELDATETTYTVYLKEGIKWHDGAPLTSKDVVFTFTTIQNPEAKSPLISSWRGITVEAIDDRTITFKLANALSAFPQSLTTGIIPEHILSSVPASQMRSVSYNNQQPIGSGPFSFNAVEVDTVDSKTNTRIAFQTNPQYHAGAPQLERFMIRTYQNDDSLVNAFQNNEIDAMVGLEVVPEEINDVSARSYSIPLTSQVMVFFKTSQEVLKDQAVRKALVLAVDKKEMFETLSYPLLSTDQPLLSSQIGYNRIYDQVTNNKNEANTVLDNSGWKRNPVSGVRTKDGLPLKFRLFSSSSSELTSLSGNLQKQWREIGAEAEVVLQSDDELQSSVATHNYDALMYGISVGADPDVYAYWHGSQGDVRSETRLNLSEYKSTVADKALEAGRTRSDKQNRAIKYRPFLEAWRSDVPALALYQPRFLYISNDKLSGFEYGIVHSSTDRFINVNQWKVRKAPQKIE